MVYLILMLSVDDVGGVSFYSCVESYKTREKSTNTLL